ncbi:MarR family transcriptional regulator [Streptomyces sp. NPDC045431]|uniref:MarR family winged helix-turn-helix transcriptional regulator n=1 Tax=Streptomyces sp. NPDC045431 TaxID=3155613 RepID=UPI0033F31946
MSDSDTRASEAQARTPTRAGRGEVHAREAAAALVALSEFADLHAPSPVSSLASRALAAVEESAPLGLSDLGKVLDITTASASRLCVRLEGAGLLVRRSHADDRRKTVLALTPAGVEVVEEWRARRADALATALPRSAARLLAVKAACDLARDRLRGAMSKGEER